MGKVVRDAAASDSSVEERRKLPHEEIKVRKKKKRSKRDLIDLQRRLLKSKKNKETKIDGKPEKARNSNRLSNRILPRPLAGIYRNGAVGKIVRRSELKVPLNDINNARLEGNVYKLLNGHDSESERIIDENDTREASKNPLLDSNIQNILQPTPPGDKSLSPVLGKVAGKKRCPRNETIEAADPSRFFDLPRKPLENKKAVNVEHLQESAIKKYEELCLVVSSENFVGQNFPDFGTDPLTATKKKLRNMYAESFRSQYLRDMIKRGAMPNETMASSSTANPPEAENRSSVYEDSDLVSVTVEKPDCQVRQRKDKRECGLPESQSLFVIPEKHFDTDVRKNDASASHLLFDLSLINSGVENVEPEPSTKTSGSKALDSPRKDGNAKYFKVVGPTHSTEGLKNESPLSLSSEARLQDNFVAKKHLLRRKNQQVQMVHLLRRGAKKHPGRGSLKASQQVRKSLKHVPAILRRCNALASNKVNLFEQSTCVDKRPQEMLQTAAKQRLLFSPQTLDRKPEARGAASLMFDPEDVQTCVVQSPSLRNDELNFRSFHEGSKLRKLNAEMFLSKKNANPPVQKTIMFTKKDSRNIGHCLHLNSLVTDRAVDNPNFCTRRTVSMDHGTSLKNACCNRCLDNSGSSYRCSQESNACPMQNTECQKVLLRRVPQQKCHNEHVCYVVVDPNNVPECSNDNGHCQEKLRPAHTRRVCQEDVPDVGILKGVQNLKILPMEEPDFSDSCSGRNTVVLEQQPVKYLAVENDSRIQKIPIYVHGNNRVASVDNVEVLEPGVNYRVVSCPQEPAHKVIFVPACEQKQVAYGKQENLAGSFEGPRTRRVILCRPEFQQGLWCVKEPSNLCQVHVPKRNLMEARKTECDAIDNDLQQGDKVKLSRHGTVRWDDLHYRSNHGNG